MGVYSQSLQHFMHPNASNHNGCRNSCVRAPHTKLLHSNRCWPCCLYRHLHTSFHTYLNFSLLFFSWNSLWDFCFCFWRHTCSWIWYSFTLFLCCFMICSFMALVLLPQASPLELLHSHAVYGFNLICGGTCLRIYKRYWIQFTSIFFFFSFYVKLNKDLYFLIAFFDEKKDVWIFI